MIWKKQIQYMFIGQIIIIAALAMSNPFWPLLLQHTQHLSGLALQLVSAAIYIAPLISYAIMAPLWGKFSDRYGKKTMVLRACLALVVTQVLIAYIDNVFLLIAIRFIQGAIAGFIAAAQAWSLAISPKQARGYVMGKLQAATAFGNIMGPVLGAIIATYLSYHSIFIMGAMMALAVAIYFHFYLKRDQVSIHLTTSKPKTAATLPTSMVSLLVLINLLQIAKMMITPVFALFAMQQLHANKIGIGLLYASAGVGLFLFAPIWGKYFDAKKQQGENFYSTLAIILFTSSMIQFGFAYSNSIVLDLVLRFAWGICLAALIPQLFVLVSEQRETNHLGNSIGLAHRALKLGSIIGIGLGALLAAQFGFIGLFVGIALLYLLAAFGLICYDVKWFNIAMKNTL